jgi:hypothetical protein
MDIFVFSLAEAREAIKSLCREGFRVLSTRPCGDKVVVQGRWS